MNPEPLFLNSEADAYDRFAQLDDLATGLPSHTSGRPLGSAYDEALDSDF